MQTQPCDKMWLVKGCEVEWIHNQCHGWQQLRVTAKVTWTLSIYKDKVKDSEALLSVDYLQNAIVSLMSKIEMWLSSLPQITDEVSWRRKTILFSTFCLVIRNDLKCDFVKAEEIKRVSMWLVLAMCQALCQVMCKHFLFWITQYSETIVMSFTQLEKLTLRG